MWSAEVTASRDGEYRVRVTAWDAAGNRETYDETLFYGLNLTFNRTQANVDRYAYLSSKGWHTFTDYRNISHVGMTASEQAEWLDPKSHASLGAYNFTDLNRVETAVDYLKTLLRGYGYTIAAVSVKVDWTMSDIPRASDLSRYLGNVEAFRYFAPFLDNMNLPGTMSGLTWQGANDIERFLARIYYCIGLMTSAFMLCGEVVCGYGIS
ncbi:MAG: hypothetical protein LBC65_03550 [Oscillospiraceae bacterium]|nr:hypothetical protein [Oscillospiraceae bacterium]